MAATEAAWQCLSQSAIGQLSSDQLAAADLACKHLLKAVNRVEEDGSRMQNWPRPTPSVLAKLVVTKSVHALKLIGALALQSLASNRALAQQEGLIHTLVACLADAGSDKVLEASANAFSDLATSDEGSASLIAHGALPVLLDRLVELPSTFASTTGKRKRTVSQSPAAFLSLLDATFALLFCQAAPAIGELPRGRASLALTAVSPATRDARISGELSPKQTARCCALAARLSLEGDAADVSSTDDVTGSADASAEVDEARSSFGRLVGFGAGGFGSFLQSTWEQRPAFFPASENEAPEGGGGGLSWPLSGVKGLGSSDEFFEFLEGAVGCPSPAAEECDVIKCLREASEELGGLLVYGRDVTLVKTIKGRLEHFDGKTERSGSALEASSKVSLVESARTGFDGPEGSLPVTENTLANPRFVSADDCREGFRNGFSIAVRGLQCRLPKIASLANDIALALGQAGVGVNAYLTPPNSQGLAPHYDDHCVFVCQLAGSKLWRVYEPLESEHMPRLYAPRAESSLAGRVCTEFKLRKGDVLYIPRGWTHVATALDEESLHVTFGVEVEEPFSWEGVLKAAVQAAKAPVDRSASPTGAPPLSPSEPSVEVPMHSFRSVRDPTSEADCGRKPDLESSAGNPTSEELRPSCRCYEAVHISADSIPELRKACLLGALHGSGSLAPATSDGPERNGLPTTLTKAAQRSALSAGELSRPTQIDGFGASSVKQNDRDPWNASMGQALGKSTKLHKPEFGGSLGRAVSQMGTEVASSSAALSNLILTEAAMKAEVEHLFRRVQAQTLVNTEDHVDKRPGDHPLEGASSQGQNVPSLLFAGRSDGQADGRFRLCCGCNEAALYETGKTQYLQRLKQYQTARRRWNEAMLAVQSSMNGH